MSEVIPEMQRVVFLVSRLLFHLQCVEPIHYCAHTMVAMSAHVTMVLIVIC